MEYHWNLEELAVTWTQQEVEVYSLMRINRTRKSFMFSQLTTETVIFFLLNNLKEKLVKHKLEQVPLIYFSE